MHGSERDMNVDKNGTPFARYGLVLQHKLIIAMRGALITFSLFNLLPNYVNPMRLILACIVSIIYTKTNYRGLKKKSVSPKLSLLSLYLRSGGPMEHIVTSTIYL